MTSKAEKAKAAKVTDRVNRDRRNAALEDEARESAARARAIRQTVAKAVEAESGFVDAPEVISLNDGIIDGVVHKNLALDRPRIVAVDGVPHEHVDTDEHGRWIYRSM